MGEVNVAYIPAAILYNAPQGLTRRQLIQKFGEIRVGLPTELKRSWQDPGPLESEKPIFHGGIFELANILGLKRSREFFISPSQGLEYIAQFNDPELLVIPCKNQKEWTDPLYSITKRTKKNNRKRVIYPNLDSLISENPDLDPEKCINWKQKKGEFYAGMWGNAKGEWIKKRKRYFLKSLLEMEEDDFTSTVITAAAIDEKAWNLFGLYGYEYTQRFLLKNQSAMKKYQEAVLAYFCYRCAKEKKMTNAEYFRFRIEMGVHRLTGQVDKTTAKSIAENEFLLSHEGIFSQTTIEVDDKTII